MASVQSLGLHRPAGLRHAIDELLLPPDAPTSSYTWDIAIGNDEGVEVEDELLTTKNCVIWSRGGIVRKAYKFDLEKEAVTQALLAYFPTSEDDQDSDSGHGAGEKTAPGKRALAKALVVFLKTKAHIYFLAGTSHVVHMPFEVESACVAPQGVIIQRKQRADAPVPVSFKFPRVPPNSFVSSQLTSSHRSSVQATFSVEGLGKPKTLPLRLSSTLENMWEPPMEQADTHWPRLVTLTDPLLDLGLVVTRRDPGGRHSQGKGLRKSPLFLDPAEEILHIEQIPHPHMGVLGQGENSLVLAVTTNRDASTYTVWKLSYIKNEDAFIGRLKKPKSKTDRRRSSMQPGFLSGSATPVQPSFRESFGAPLPGKRLRKSEKVEVPLDFVSSLDPDREKEPGTTRRTSRRVSSMLARADLSVSQDRSVFAEQPLIPNHAGSKRIESHGSHRFSGGRGSLTYGQTIHPSLGSLLEAPIDINLDEGFHNMGLDDHDFDGLAQEVLFTKIHTMPLDNSNVRYSLSSKPAKSQCKVFFIVAPPFATDDRQRSQVMICIQDPVEKRLRLLTLHLETHQSPSHHPPTGGNSAPETQVIVVGQPQVMRAQGVVDSCKISDGDISAILILSETMDGLRELSIQAPWSELTKVTIPLLFLDDLRSLHHEGRAVDRDARQKKSETIEFATRNMTGLRHPRRRGVVDMVDSDGRLHQLRVQLQPLSPQVKRVLNVCRSILPSSYGEKVVAGWWHVVQWLHDEDLPVADKEWSCLVIELFVIFLALGRANLPSSVSKTASQKKRRGPSGSFGAIQELEDWRTLQLQETPNSAGCPQWMLNRAWQWTMDDEAEPGDDAVGPALETPKFIPTHIQYARQYMASVLGDKATGPSGYLPTAIHRSMESRRGSAWDIFMGLHLLLEEQKLNTMTPEYLSPGRADLRVVMCQVARWLKWHDFVSTYELGIQEDIDPRHDAGKPP